MMWAWVALAAWLVVARYPETPVGRVLHGWLVERLSAVLARIGRGHVALLFLCVVAATGLVWLVGAEGARLMAMGSPELIGWAASVEATSLLDAAVTAMLAASMLRLGPVTRRVRGAVRRLRRRRLRDGAVRVVAKPADEDERRRSWHGRHGRGSARPGLLAQIPGQRRRTTAR